ncbi:MAG: hypothetical protein U9Q77_09645 [Candidatus Marinimicrobia bacterium]|nr:hypothetical protein [Candidatus Neomarinimicrobiota bacterium]
MLLGKSHVQDSNRFRQNNLFLIPDSMQILTLFVDILSESQDQRLP